MTKLYVQTQTGASFNVGCSGQTAGSVTTAGQAVEGGTAGSTEVGCDPGTNVTRACAAFDCSPAPGSGAVWAAGTWSIPINHTTMDGGTQLVRVDVCDFNGSTFTTVASNTSPGHTRGATGIITVNVTQGSAHTPQSATLSRPFIVLTYNNSDTHGASALGITPNQTITAPIVIAYTLAADGGSYAKTGTAASLEFGREVVAGAGSYAVSGQDAELSLPAVIEADAGSYAVAGQAVSLESARELVVDAGSYTHAGNDEALLDSYDESNANLELALSASNTAMAQMFTASATGKVTRARFYIRDDGVGTDGLFQAKLYASTGTVGSGANPTGSSLALSSGYLASTLSGSLTMVEFTFSGANQYEVQSGMDYGIAIDRGSSDGRVNVGLDSTSPTHAGNLSSHNGTQWLASAGLDLVFELYAEVGRTELILGAAADPALTAGAGAYVLTGATASLEHGRAVDAGAGSYVLTGTAASLELGREVAADAGAYSLSGTDANLPRDALVALDVGSYTASGQDAGLFKGRTLTADGGTLAETGDDVALEHGKALAAGAGAVIVTGATAGLLVDRTVAVDAGTLSIIGQAAGIEFGRAVAADAGAYSLSGQNAGLLYDRALAAETTTFTVNGQDATLTLTSPGAFVLDAEAGSITLTGQTAALQHAKRIAADTMAYTVTGQASTLALDRKMVPEAGSFIVNGVDATLLAQRNVLAAAGVYALAGLDVTLEWSGAAGSAASYLITLARRRGYR